MERFVTPAVKMQSYLIELEHLNLEQKIGQGGFGLVYKVQTACWPVVANTNSGYCACLPYRGPTKVFPLLSRKHNAI